MQNEQSESIIQSINQDINMIDVVEDFSLPWQSSNYQEAFRIWRRKKKNPYGFQFTKNMSESEFSESHSISAQSPSQVEQDVLRRIGSLAGYALVFYLVIENVFDKIAVLIMHMLQLEIEIVFFGESRLYGDENLIFWLSFLTNFLKYLIPACMMQFAMKLPLCVSVPTRIRKSSQLIGGIALAMLLSIGLGMLGVSRSAELEKYRLISESVVSEDRRMIVYILATIFILPLVSEFLLHGCLFQALRQFGDMFAITANVVIAIALTHNIWDAFRIGLVNLTISYYLIRTGSFWSAVLIRIVHEIYMFALFCMETYEVLYSVEWWLMLLVPCVLGGVVWVSLLRSHKKAGVGTAPENRTYLNLQEKLTAFLTTVPMVGFLICCVLLMVVTTMLI
ncbi:MAG: CPBP family intramembrane metalloprotease [Oscillospiraceae bacterium]|nr:CPBP family intramembrane metalloprotease [Oscillospiraceae bacterium]